MFNRGLVRQLAHLQVHQHNALEQVVVKNQVDKTVFALHPQVFLPCDKGKAFAQLQQKGLQLVQQALLQVFFVQSRHGGCP